MVLVLTNDDGIGAPGLQALQRAVELLNRDAIVVAPQEHLSGCSHQVTTNKPIQIQQYSEKAHAIAGTPVDCVRIAVSNLCPRIEFVLSGINSGGNLGADIYISGTVAAVREATLHRISGISISHYRQGKRPIDWELATHLAVKVLGELLCRPQQPGVFWNVNLPHLLPGTVEPEIVFCAPCTQPLPAVYRMEGNQLYYSGEYTKRPRDLNSDVEVCFSGKISVSQVFLWTVD